jgi:hypothetical protein
VVEWGGLENRYTGNRIEGSNPSLSARFFIENFSQRHCEHSEAIQKTQYLRAFQLFDSALDPYLGFSSFAILPPKSLFLASLSPIHANTPGEGTHVLKALIYLGFRG